MSADLVELVKTGKMSEMNTLSGCQYDYPEILEYLKEADIISIQMGSNDAFVPTVVAIGNATNWKSEDLASIVLSGNLRSKDPETRAAFQASMKKLRLTKSETDAVWNLVTSGMNKICTDAYPVSTANIRLRCRDRPRPEPGRTDPAHRCHQPRSPAAQLEQLFQQAQQVPEAARRGL